MRTTPNYIFQFVTIQGNVTLKTSSNATTRMLQKVLSDGYELVKRMVRSRKYT